MNWLFVVKKKKTSGKPTNGCGSAVRQHEVGQKPAWKTLLRNEGSVTRHFLQTDFWTTSNPPCRASITSGFPATQKESGSEALARYRHFSAHAKGISSINAKKWTTHLYRLSPRPYRKKQKLQGDGSSYLKGHQ